GDHQQLAGIHCIADLSLLLTAVKRSGY
ncbi:hypothetical protein VN97_g13217, partial [Penicillium thymicola]